MEGLKTGGVWTDRKKGEWADGNTSGCVDGLVVKWVDSRVSK